MTSDALSRRGLLKGLRAGIAAWLDEQLHPETIDDSATDAQVAALFPTLGYLGVCKGVA